MVRYFVIPIITLYLNLTIPVVVSRLIEGEYFKIDQMLSSDYETKVRMNKKELAQLYRQGHPS